MVRVLCSKAAGTYWRESKRSFLGPYSSVFHKNKHNTLNLRWWVCKPLRKEKQVFQKDTPKSFVTNLFSNGLFKAKTWCSYEECEQAPGGQVLGLMYQDPPRIKEVNFSQACPPAGQCLSTSFLSTSPLHSASENWKGLFSRGLVVWFPDFRERAKNNKKAKWPCPRSHR